MGPLRKAMWWAADYLYGVWMHVRAPGLRVPKHYRIGDRNKPVVLILPGVYETWSFLKPIADRLNQAGYRVSVVRGLGYNLLPIVETAVRLNRALKRLDAPQAGRVIVAHSKGGLVGKQLMILNGSRLRIRGLVAIATPFQGSRYARYVLDPYLRTFIPTNETIVALGAEASVNADIVSVYGSFDPHVPDGSELAGAVNMPLDVAGHFRILCAPATLDAVQQAVGRLASSPAQHERPRGEPASDTSGRGA